MALVRKALCPLVRICCASLSMLLATTAASQSIGDWRPVPMRNAPPATTGFALIESPFETVLMLDGTSTTADYAFDGLTWQPFLSNLPRRDNAAFGRRGNEMVRFGGVANGQLFSDTWVSTTGGFTWTQASSPPSLLTDVSMAFDAASDRLVMVGMEPAGSWQTWFWQTGWTAGPSFATANARLVADELRGAALLFTEQPAGVAVSRLDGSAWTVLAQTAASFTFGEVAFDARRGRAVMLQPFDDLATVEWNGIGFDNAVPATGSFLPLASTAMVWFGARQELLLVLDRGNGLEVLRHAAASAPGARRFADPCGAAVLTLAPGSRAIPGATHTLQSDGPGSGLGLSVLGFTNADAGGLALPISLPGGSCGLQVDPAIVDIAGNSPATSSVSVTLPFSGALLGERYYAQFVFFANGGFPRATNGLEVQIGSPAIEGAFVESFDTALQRDPSASSATWSGGATAPGQIGGDGRHGSFDLSLAVQVAPGVYEIDTDNTVIPAARTLTGQQEVVTDGRFFFSDLSVPAGVTVRFVGTQPVQLFVRGSADVQGTLSVDAPDMPSVIQTSGPATGLPVTTFNARNSGVFGPTPGQPGGAGGPGGGRGGNGGDEGTDQGPTIVNGVDVTSGQDGDDVQLAAGHAYASLEVGTGGKGSLLTPATGMWQSPFPLVGSVYSGYFSPGGGGGGYRGAGSSPQQPQHTGTSTIVAGPLAAGGGSFAVLPYPASAPAGYSSLQHFAVGGSGGGGGGSHGYGLLSIGPNPIERWMAGHGGAGGGGVLVLRCGNRADVAGSLSARGGSGVVIAGDDPYSATTTDTYGISSPGGGGSGGSILVQARTASVSGSVDVSGGEGSVVGFMVNVLQSMTGGGGDGAAGYYRFETSGALQFTGTGVPAFSFADNRGPLQDTDDRSGSRSRWLRLSQTALPVYVRYELLVDINGLPVLFSDDPSVSPLAADDPAGAVQLRFQGARRDPVSGQPAAGSIGPWRPYARPGANSVNADFAELVRFDLVTDQTVGSVQVLDLKIVWR
ncbi:MAG: hypothetical protein KAI24_13705 [Planctomycetes bacterium]|nr:hypothetical protein [Planctomycetota bacterium]